MRWIRDSVPEESESDRMAKILVIDDDPMMLQLYREILTRAGHEVVIAENGMQGLARADRQPDLIVVDLMMPNLNGYEFVKQLRASDGHAKTPVIAASGLSTGEWAVRSGADRFLAKPFRSHELIALIDELLGGDRPAA
jgi:twitching motility two-component system response regulator PilH